MKVSGTTLVILEAALIVAIVLGLGFRELYVLRRAREAARRARRDSEGLEK